jgi:hypothetical protein
MLLRKILIVSALLLFGIGNACATAQKVRRHYHYHDYVVVVPDTGPVNQFGGRLVYHPASNIACDTRYRATRALPCDQPVWVYGSPCEVDLGLGRSRPCN